MYNTACLFLTAVKFCEDKRFLLQIEIWRNYARAPTDAMQFSEGHLQLNSESKPNIQKSQTKTQNAFASSFSYSSY